MIDKDFQSQKRKFYSSREWKQLAEEHKRKRELVDGRLCECCRSSFGTESHHIIPITPKNINDPKVTLNVDNLKLLCNACHHRNEQSRIDKYKHKYLNMVDGTYLDEFGDFCEQKIHIVWGSPYSGKSNYVDIRKEDGDFIVNNSVLFQAFSGEKQDNFPENLFGNIMDIRDDIYRRIQNKQIKSKNIWIIETLPTKMSREKMRMKFPTADFVFVDKTKDECILRLQANDKYTDSKLVMQGLISKWFEQFEP